MPQDWIGMRLGNHEITEEIGRGGMGVVYKARQLTLNRLVAIKILPWALARDPEIMRRFEREAQAVALLNHPNIVTIHDLGSEQDLQYIVMEYIQGEELEKRLRARGRLKAREVLEIARQTAAALGAAHRAGIIHRDIKPSNIMLCADGRVKVMDFGIARIVTAGTKLTASGYVIGTAHYVSPEQYRDEELTPRSDLYALGVVLYQMLTGQLPFDAKTPIGLAEKIRSAPPPPILGFLPNISLGLERLVGRLLSKDPADRPEHGGALEAEIAALMAGEEFRVPERIEDPPIEPPDRPEAEIQEGPTNKFRTPRDGAVQVAAKGQGRTGGRGGADLTEDENRTGRGGSSGGSDKPDKPDRSDVAAPARRSRRLFVSVALAVVMTLAVVAVAAFGWLWGRDTDRKSYTEMIDGVDLEMVWIPGGIFKMGSPAGEAGRSGNEGPQRDVKVEGYWIGKYEVTQELWQEVRENNPSRFKESGRLPVDSVSWEDCMRFCWRVSKMTGKRFELPTEAQWEYACRAGSMGRFSFEDSGGGLEHVAWHVSNSGGRTHKVGGGAANEWGLRDMHGNVWEWCRDRYRLYSGGEPPNPIGPQGRQQRVLRGGSWSDPPGYLRSAVRSPHAQDARSNNFGLRLVRIP